MGEHFKIAAAEEAPLCYRVSQAAKLLNVSRSKMWAMVSSDEIFSTKIGGCVVIPREDLQALLRRPVAKADQSSIK
ncbi:helix-turn-helix domain-containing protein [Methylobacterium sp. BTF04]|nr:helix-turn-helix domain-containing protein [Methylobacterium sp. BTF04]